MIAKVGTESWSRFFRRSRRSNWLKRPARVFVCNLLDLSNRNNEFECFGVAFTQRFSGISEARFAASEGAKHHEQLEVGGTRCFRVRGHFPGMLTRLPCCCQEGVGGDHPSAS